MENPRTLFHGSISPLRLNQTSNQRASRNIESNARQMIIKHKHLPRLWQHFWSRPQDIANLRYGSGLRNKRSIITPYISCATTYWLPWSRKRYELTRTKQKENSRFWNWQPSSGSYTRTAWYLHRLLGQERNNALRSAHSISLELFRLSSVRCSDSGYLYWVQRLFSLLAQPASFHQLAREAINSILSKKLAYHFNSSFVSDINSEFRGEAAINVCPSVIWLIIVEKWVYCLSDYTKRVHTWFPSKSLDRLVLPWKKQSLDLKNACMDHGTVVIFWRDEIQQHSAARSLLSSKQKRWWHSRISEGRPPWAGIASDVILRPTRAILCPRSCHLSECRSVIR